MQVGDVVEYVVGEYTYMKNVGAIGVVQRLIGPHSIQVRWISCPLSNKYPKESENWKKCNFKVLVKVKDVYK